MRKRTFSHHPGLADVSIQPGFPHGDMQLPPLSILSAPLPGPSVLILDLAGQVCLTSPRPPPPPQAEAPQWTGVASLCICLTLLSHAPLLSHFSL